MHIPLVKHSPPTVLPFFPPPVVIVKPAKDAYPRTPLKEREENVELDVSEITLSTPVHKRHAFIEESENCMRPLKVSDQVARIEDNLKRRQSVGGVSTPN